MSSVTTPDTYILSESGTQASIPIVISINEGTDALQIGGISIEVKSGGITHDTITRNIQVAPVID